MHWVRLGFRLLVRSLRRPSLGIDLLRVSWRFRSRKWYREFPFLPVPHSGYLRWRLHTAYGDEGAMPTADDIERYARWAVKSR
jgi:hypothetical protein